MHNICDIFILSLILVSLFIIYVLWVKRVDLVLLIKRMPEEEKEEICKFWIRYFKILIFLIVFFKILELFNIIHFLPQGIMISF